MKKNIMMRLASFLLVAVLISTSAISGTYAKYVTADEGKDHARVAKFGVVVEADSDIFDVEYLGKEDGWTGKMTVQATENVVAPGTTKTMANVKLSGTPEVAVRVSNEKVNFEIGDFWMVDDDCNDVNDANYKAEKFYCPLIINVVDAAGTEHNLCGLDYPEADLFEADVEAAMGDAAVEYAPNTDLSSVQDIQITWTWVFENGHVDQSDVFDTQLGDRAAKNQPGTIDIALTTTVTQID